MYRGGEDDNGTGTTPPPPTAIPSPPNVLLLLCANTGCCPSLLLWIPSVAGLLPPPPTKDFLRLFPFACINRARSSVDPSRLLPVVVVAVNGFMLGGMSPPSLAESIKTEPL